jgi:hypothetical protein
MKAVRGVRLLVINDWSAAETYLAVRNKSHKGLWTVIESGRPLEFEEQEELASSIRHAKSLDHACLTLISQLREIGAKEFMSYDLNLNEI